MGKGSATKEQVQHMVKTLLALSDTPQEDAADALAAALCHSHSRQCASNILRMSSQQEKAGKDSQKVGQT